MGAVATLSGTPDLRTSHRPLHDIAWRRLETFGGLEAWRQPGERVENACQARFAASIREDSLDLMRAARLGWMTRAAAARSTLRTTERKASVAAAASPPMESRRRRMADLISDLAARFLWRRTRL